MRADESVSVVRGLDALRGVAGEEADAFRGEPLLHAGDRVVVLPHEEMGVALHHRHGRTQAGERLRQFAADWAATEDDEPLGQRAQLPDGIRRIVAGLAQAGDGRHERRAASRDDDGARRDLPAVHAHAVGRDDLGVAMDAVHAQPGVPLHGILGFDRRDDPLHALHDVREVELRGRALETVVLGARDVVQHLGGAQQGLAGHAARVQAVAAHAVAFDQRDLGLDRGGDQRTDQAPGPRPDHDEVGVEPFGFLEPAQNRPRLGGVQRLFGDQREQAEQGERNDQPRGDDAGHGRDLPQLCAGVHIDHGAGQHPDLADPVERPRRQRRDRHGQVDREEGEGGHEPEREQVEGAVFFDSAVDGGKLPLEAGAHRIAEQIPRDGERQRGAQRTRERHQDDALPEPEDRPGDEGEQRRAGQRQARDRHVQGEERPRGGQRRLGVERGNRVALRGEVFERQKPLQVEREERGDQQREHAQQHDLFEFHPAPRLLKESDFREV